MSDVLTEEGDGVLVVSLNRPEARNAVNEARAAPVAETRTGPVFQLGAHRLRLDPCFGALAAGREGE